MISQQIWIPNILTPWNQRENSHRKHVLYVVCAHEHFMIAFSSTKLQNRWHPIVKHVVKSLKNDQVRFVLLSFIPRYNHNNKNFSCTRSAAANSSLLYSVKYRSGFWRESRISNANTHSDLCGTRTTISATLYWIINRNCSHVHMDTHSQLWKQSK